MTLTYDEYYVLPDDGKWYEVLDGVLSIRPTPNLKHALVHQNLLFEMHDFAKKSRLGAVYLPLDVVLSETNVVQPDIIFVSNERKHILTEACVRGAPDLLVEVVFEATRERDEVTKLSLYERFGVEEYWIIDAELETARIYRRRGAKFEEQTTMTGFATPLLPGFEISLAEIFEN